MKVLDYDGTDHLIDKIYDAINSGGSADYIVEECTSGIWTYRKWASGVAECWGTQTETKASYVTLGNNWYGFNTTNVSFPFTFLQTPNVNASMKIGSSLSFASPLISVSTTAVGSYGMAYGQSASTTVIVNYQIKGLWKEFTPSISAKAQIGYEDFTSQVTVNTTYYNVASASAKRVGNIGYLMYRLTIKTNFTNAQDIPILTLPHNVANDLINFMWFFRSGSGIARPVMESANNQIFEKYYGNAQSGDTVDFIFVYTIAN